MANVFFVPKYIVSGEGALEESMIYMKGFGRRALIVTDEMMVQLGNVRMLTDCLDDVCIDYRIYKGVNAEPDDIMVRAGERIYRGNDCDFLIGLGGGSPIDAAKAIGTVVSNGGDICEFGKRKIVNTLPPIAAIPTTAGTGSEATRVAVIKDSVRGVKMMMSDVKLMASLAVIDPVFTLTAPSSVTVNTGVDALCHAIESYTSRKAFPLSKLYSMDAIKKIFRSLHKVYIDGTDLKARKEMAEASLEAGIAFSNSSVSIIHGMSRPIGALFHIPHGLSNAILLKTCLPYIKRGASQELYELSKDLDIYKGMDVEEGADTFVKAIYNMLEKLEVMSVDLMKIDKKEFFESIPKMTEDAMASGSPQNCKNIPKETEIYALYKRLWE